MEFRYTAIVIGKKDVGETDRLYTFYTREAGKIRVIARGVRKVRAKLAGQLETFSLGGVTIVRGRGSGTIAGAVAEEYFPSLRESEIVFPLAFEAAAAIDKLLGFDEPDEPVFRLFSSLLFLLDEYAERGEGVKAALALEGFFFTFFSELGYRFEAARCAGGEETLVRGERYFFCPDIGGITCEDHRSKYSIPFSENGVKLLRIILGSALRSLGRVVAAPSDLEELRRARKLLFQYITR